MFIAALFVIIPNWKLPKCPSLTTVGWVNEMDIHTIEILQSNKVNDFTQRVNIRNYVELKSWIQREQYYRMPFTQSSEIGKTDDRNEQWIHLESDD